MPHRWEHMPKPEPIWIALGILVAAFVMTLSPRRKAAFLAALTTVADTHESMERVVAFDLRLNHARAMSHSIRGGVAWIRRLVSILETAPEP